MESTRTLVCFVPKGLSHFSPFSPTLQKGAWSLHPHWPLTCSVASCPPGGTRRPGVCAEAPSSLFCPGCSRPAQLSYPAPSTRAPATTTLNTAHPFIRLALPRSCCPHSKCLDCLQPPISRGRGGVGIAMVVSSQTICSNSILVPLSQMAGGNRRPHVPEWTLLSWTQVQWELPRAALAAPCPSGYTCGPQGAQSHFRQSCCS